MLEVFPNLDTSLLRGAIVTGVATFVAIYVATKICEIMFDLTPCLFVTIMLLGALSTNLLRV